MHPRRIVICGLLTLLTLGGCGDGDPVTPAGSNDLGDRVEMRSPATVVQVRRDPYRLQLLDPHGALIAGEIERHALFYERAGTRHDITAIRSHRATGMGLDLEVDTTEGKPATVTLRFLSPRTLEVVFQPPQPETVTMLGDQWDTPGDEVIYGLTTRLRDSRILRDSEVPIEDVTPVEVGSLNRRGERVEMYVRPTIALYTPFYQSSRGYGLSVAGTAVGEFDVAQSHPSTLAFRFETGTSAESRMLRYHVFHGPSHATITDEYTALTGRPFVPPAWAFLHWRWRDELAIDRPALLDGVAMNAQVVDDVTMYEQLGIPAGVYLFDRPVLEGEFGFARFHFDEVRLPNAGAMLAALRQRGYRILTWSSMWACGSGAGDNGLEALQLGFLAPGSSGVPHCANVGGGSFILDPTTPAARQWWQEKLSEFVRTYDLDGIKLDRGEEFIPSDAADIWADGRSGREVRNLYPVLQAQVHHDALHAVRDDDFLVITRSGYTGVQRHAIAWGGDVSGAQLFGIGPGTDLGLRSVIISQQRAAFMGLPIWGSDTGGYYEFKDRDVFARWIQFSTFSGIMEIGGHGAHAPWDMPTEPRFDPEMIEIYRRYTQLRHRLQGYIVAAAREAGETGMPLARPLVFAYADDPNVRDRWDEYLFGPDLLVAPVWRSGQRAREVYLPSGAWRSFWDESRQYRGPTTITVDAPLAEIPVFIRDAAPNPAT
jgi:alpha-D-xyloside xylohydrolase